MSDEPKRKRGRPRRTPAAEVIAPTPSDKVIIREGVCEPEFFDDEIVDSPPPKPEILHKPFTLSAKKLTQIELERKMAELQELEKLIQLRDALPHLNGFPWYKWAWDFFNTTNKAAFLCSANQVSKAQLLDEDIPTPTGIKKMRDIMIGDYVFSQDGVPVKVIDIPYIGIDDAFDIEFNDKSRVVVSGKHDWICKGYRERFRKKYKATWARSKNYGQNFDNENYGKWIVKSTEEIISSGAYNPSTIGTKRHSIPISAPVELSGSDLFDPYYVGLFIGNGSNRSLTNNQLDEDLSDHCAQYGNKRLKVGVVGIRSDVWHKLCLLGLNVCSYDKKIPEEYRMGSIAQRKDLLAGMLDTDGTCDKRGQNYNYATTSPILADQVLELICSLGGMGTIKKYPSYYYKDTGEKIICRDHYVITFWTTFNPFRSKRKSSLWRENSRYKHERVITKILPIGKRKMKCITVESPDGSYLCTKNYIVTHNSSTQIRKIIDWATDVTKWKKLWPNLLPGQKPNQFWLFYPTGDVWQAEFESKWVPDFLPRGPYKDHPQYGWKEYYDKGIVKKIEFNSGVTLYCKTYSQKAKDLQSGSCHYIGLDEEPPQELMPEISARLRATNGYLSAVFTPTTAQDYWRRVIEPKNREEELYPHAFKKTVSLYDSQTYIDGTSSRWTKERIEEIIAECGTQAEVQRRVFGRFIKSEGLLYESFDIARNVIPARSIPPDWMVYSAVDPGSGGQSGHPAAMLFIAVRPDYKEAWAFRARRMDHVATANTDILNEYRAIRGKLVPIIQLYDYKDKDFFLVACGQGETFTPADKTREKGIGLLNSLFKNNMFKIFAGDPELDKLIGELSTLAVKTDKRKASDDICDCARYICMAVPWDMSELAGPEAFLDVPRTAPKPMTSEEERREFYKPKLNEETIDQEFSFWNDIYD